ncbi:hypothetical protein G6F57_022138 [Rhizopus arrhizus]|nr:hypothetical protein G6F57_022138 [Rhizopus arrhizus]
MQVGVLVDPGQRRFHRTLHAVLVDVAHVIDIDLVGLDQALFFRVHRADADLVHLRRGDRRRRAAQPGLRIGAKAAQAGHRHAVDVARRPRAGSCPARGTSAPRR